MTLTLLTLGGLQASVTDAGGVTRTLGRGKPVAMLAYLAGIPGHKVSREHLAALLWGDVESEAARQNLRQTVWYLKKKLGENLLDGTGEMLSLAAPFTCDRDEFLQAAQRADFATAVRRYTGPFIPDFAAPGASEFEQWCELERRRLMVTFLRCADALARQWMGEGHFREAQELARRARDADPMDQATWRLLLEALIAGSDGLGAMSEAEHLEAFLAKEEQEPEAATIAALRAARRSPTIRAPSESSPSSSIAAELVGREAEFSRVLAAWDGARAGSPRVLVVAAAAGLGKSRLLRDLHARLRASRSRCVLLRANPGDRHLSGGFAAAVAAHLAEFPGAAAVSTGSAGVLVSLAPTLASLYPSAAPDASDGEDAVRRRALALADLLHAVSDEHPVAVLLDDLHWADEHSVRVIAAALSRLEHARLLVVLTRRPVADPQALLGAFEQLALPPLDLAAVNAFVTQVAELPATAWADVLPQQLLLATGGSPLLLVETLHDALEQGWLSVSDAGVWECDDPLRVTNSLREGSALEQRTMRLPACAQHTLLVLALVGRPIETEDASAMAGGDADDVREHLETLERSGFVIRHGSQLLVAHDEIADAVIAASPVALREQTHAAIARVFLQRSQDETALRRAAEHTRLAGDEGLQMQLWRSFVAVRRQKKDRRTTAAVAADLLGEEVSSPTVQRLARATPFWRRRRAPWAVAAVTALTVVASSAFAWTQRAAPAPMDEFVFVVADSTADQGKLVRVRIDPRQPWDARLPLVAEDADSADYPPMPDIFRQVMVRLPAGDGWLGGATLKEFGDEPIIIDPDGRPHTPMRHRGDDGISDLSPDGRLALALTSRFDTITDHMQVAVLPLRGGALRRLTYAAEIAKTPIWRPDGTQIAYVRHYLSQRRAEQVCLIDFSGLNERCLADLPSPPLNGVRAWLDNSRILFESTAGALWIVNVESGRSEMLTGIFGNLVEAAGPYFVCNCTLTGDGNRSMYVLFGAEPSAPRAVLYRGRPLNAEPRYVSIAPRSREWLETLRLNFPSRGAALGLVHRLRPEGRLASGAPAHLHDLRWAVRDTTIATVDSLGRLRPKRVGSTWVVVSAGGWRVDSALVPVVKLSERSVFSEQWTADWEQRWRAFGEPRAVVVKTPAGPALLPNGDGSYPSGAHLRRALPARDGFGVEFEASLPVQAVQWQTLSLAMLPASSLRLLEAWNGRDGPGPTVTESCALNLPGDEGIAGLDSIGVWASGSAVARSAPPGLFSGSWHRIRLQWLPDGRCALAVDGRPLTIISPSAPIATDSLVVRIVGHDRFNGRLVVGKLDAWTGVRGGVDWTVLDEPPKKTPRD